MPMLSQRCQRGFESPAKIRLCCLMAHHRRFAVGAAALVVALALSALLACCTASALQASSLQDHVGSSSVPTPRPHGSKEPTVSGRQRLTLDAHDPESTCTTTCPGHLLTVGNVAIHVHHDAINASSGLRCEEVRDNQQTSCACVYARVQLLCCPSFARSGPTHSLQSRKPTSYRHPTPIRPHPRANVHPLWLLAFSSPAPFYPPPPHRGTVAGPRSSADTTAYHARDRSLCAAGTPQLGVARLPLSMT